MKKEDLNNLLPSPTRFWFSISMQLLGALVGLAFTILTTIVIIKVLFLGN